MQYSIVFPGQGSQSLGMLSELYDNFSVVSETFTCASDLLGFDLYKLIQEQEQALNQTKNTQVAMLVAGYATYKALNSEVTLSPLCMAGHSLGEYTALLAAKVFSFSDAIKLVQKRAELMQLAVANKDGAMVAILGLDDDKVIKICKDYSGDGIVEAANFNANGQVVISGNKEAVHKTCQIMKENGARRTVLLPVSIPSHCSLMKNTANQFKDTIDKIDFNMTQVPVLHNFDAKISNNIEEIKAKLIAQLYKPVMWTKTIKTMQEMGIVRIIESGPGKVLTGLTKKIDKHLIANAIINCTSLKSTIDEIYEK
jgi:[acyl-carrier-protein] S-malonyltransferase